MSFSRQPCPVWLFTDLNGNILDDTYYAHFLQNTIPYLPQFVYQDPQGLIKWNDPIRFLANGTLPNNLYFQEGVIYRIEVRKGILQSDPLIDLIQNFDPSESTTPVPAISLPIDNQITNPQFSIIDFNETLTLTNTGMNNYPIAPGWVLELDSVGASVIQLDRLAIAGTDRIPTDVPNNPSYVLKFTKISGTFTTIKLRQRFSQTPAIWAEQGVSITVTGKMDTNSGPIQVKYRPNMGNEILILGETLSSAYQELSGSLLLPASGNTNKGAAAYVDIVIYLPIDNVYYLTNIQVIGSPEPQDYPYAQVTVERQADHTFNVYKNSLLLQPKDNLLVGWTFALNPWQFTTTASTNVANNAYTADQTILIQQPYVASATANNVAVGRGTAAQNYAYVVTAVTAANQFAIVQYIDPATIRPYWGNYLSALVKTRIATTHGSLIKFKARLIYRADLPATISQTQPVTSWSLLGEPVLAAGWTAIAPLNDPTYTIGDDSVPFSFDQFLLPASSADAMVLGIMIYTLNSMNQTATADAILFDRVSLVPNDYAIDASPETYDETLRKCQFYYENSYAKGVLPGANDINGSQNVLVPIITGNNFTEAYRKRIFQKFKQTKRANPTLKFYTPAGIADNVLARVVNGNADIVGPQNLPITGWTQESLCQDSLIYYSNTTTNFYSANITQMNYEGILQYHYIADSRMGI